MTISLEWDGRTIVKRRVSHCKETPYVSMIGIINQKNKFFMKLVA